VGRVKEKRNTEQILAIKTKMFKQGKGKSRKLGGGIPVKKHIREIHLNWTEEKRSARYWKDGSLKKEKRGAGKNRPRHGKPVRAQGESHETKKDENLECPRVNQGRKKIIFLKRIRRRGGYHVGSLRQTRRKKKSKQGERTPTREN